MKIKLFFNLLKLFFFNFKDSDCALVLADTLSFSICIVVFSIIIRSVTIGLCKLCVTHTKSSKTACASDYVGTNKELNMYVQSLYLKENRK